MVNNDEYEDDMIVDEGDERQLPSSGDDIIDESSNLGLDDDAPAKTEIKDEKQKADKDKTNHKTLTPLNEGEKSVFRGISSSSDLIELLIAAEELKYEFECLIKDSKSTIQIGTNEKKELNGIKNTIENFCDEARRISVQNSESGKTLENILNNFEENLKESIHAIDFSFVKKEVADKLKSISKNIPVDDINHAIGGIKRSLSVLTDVLKTHRDTIQTHLELLSKSEESIDSSTKQLINAATKVSQEGKKINNKKLPVVVVGSIISGVLIGFAVAFFLMKSFIVSQISSMSKDIAISQYEILENDRYGKLYSKYKHLFGTNSKGELYIKFQKDGAFQQKESFIYYYPDKN